MFQAYCVSSQLFGYATLGTCSKSGEAALLSSHVQHVLVPFLTLLAILSIISVQSARVPLQEIWGARRSDIIRQPREIADDPTFSLSIKWGLVRC